MKFVLPLLVIPLEFPDHRKPVFAEGLGDAKELDDPEPGDSLLNPSKSTGVTQKELSARLGQASNYIHYIESGVRRADVVEFFQIAKLLGV